VVLVVGPVCVGDPLVEVCVLDADPDGGLGGGPMSVVDSDTVVV
jgi:hypothetical protein